MGGEKGGSLAPGEFRLLLSLDSNSRNRWNQQVSGPSVETSSTIFVTEVIVGFLDDFELSFVLPWASVHASDEMGSDDAAGFGDLLARVYWNASKGKFRYGSSAGLYLPVGNLAEQDLAGIATFKSGTVDPYFALYLSRPGFLGFDWQGTLNLRAILASNDDNVKFGSSLTTSLGLGRPVHRLVRAGIHFTYLHRGSDEMSQMTGHSFEDSGGHWLYLQPSATVTLVARASYAIQLIVGGRLPLVQNVNGTQLVESPAWNVGFANTFSF